MESYYGRPIIKEPVWKPEIPFYLFTGGLALVGEAGPELVRLPRGADVINHREMTSGMASGGVTLRLEGVSEGQLLDIVERGLLVRLRAAGTAY